MNTESTDRAHEDQVLSEWCHRLAQAYDVPELEVDIKAILGLSGRAAHTIMRPAAPLTTFVVGYAAGVAAASGKMTSAEACASATDKGFQLCRDTAGPAQPHD